MLSPRVGPRRARSETLRGCRSSGHGRYARGGLADALAYMAQVKSSASVIARTRMAESRDVGSVRTDLAGLATFTAALFLIVFGLLRGNAEGWGSVLILSGLGAGGALLVVFVVV